MLGALRQIAQGLARQFGSDCQVVVYDLRSSPPEGSVVGMENGHVCHRQPEEGPSPVVLEALKRAPDTLEDKLCYLTRTREGRILKSSTMYLRDEAGEVAAILTINYDITSLLAIEGSLRSLISTDQTPDRPQKPERPPLRVNEVLDQLIRQSIQLVGKPVAMMTKEDKIKAIQFLNDAGAFLITKSGDKVSKQFGISKYTLYSYMDASRTE